jgi:hypothetical protein
MTSSQKHAASRSTALAADSCCCMDDRALRCVLTCQANATKWTPKQTHQQASLRTYVAPPLLHGVQKEIKTSHSSRTAAAAWMTEPSAAS